nr:BLTX548 [Nephila pilipes]
MDRTAQ